MADHPPTSSFYCPGCFAFVATVDDLETGRLTCHRCGNTLLVERQGSVMSAPAYLMVAMLSHPPRAKELERERDEARYYARVLAHAILTETTPPQLAVAAAIAYPVIPGHRERQTEPKV